MTLIYLSLAWLGGIALAARAPNLGITFWLVCAGLAALGWLVGFSNRPSRLLFGCGLLLALGAARHALATPRFDDDDLASYNDQGYVTLEGIINSAPDVRDAHVNLRVKVESVSVEDVPPRDVSGLALVQAPRFGDYRYGNKVRVQGNLETPPEFEDFSYRDYLAREGIHSLIRFARVDSSGERAGNPLRRAMLDFRSLAEAAITRLLPDPQASLLKGILLGVESGITPTVRDDFNATGATYIIAISGANLAILAGVLRGFTRRWMSSNWSAIATIAGILVYTLFVGGDPAVVRAFFMATVGISGLELGRRTHAPTTLSLVALVMTALNPFILWDVGFLLSFLSTWGIVLYAEPLSNGMQRLLTVFFSGETATRIVAASAEAVVVTVAAQITTTPIIALYFRRLSLVSLPVNLLIVPAQGPLMILGGIAVLAAMLIWPLGQLLAWVSWLFLTYTLVIVRAFADLPLAAVGVNVAPGFIWAFYVLLFVGTFVAAQGPIKRARWRESLGRALGVKSVAAAEILLALLLGAVAVSMPDGRLHIRFLNVEGGATLIQTPTGNTILVDAGRSGRELSTQLGDVLPFWDRRLDLVVVTQPVPSHIGGLPSAMKRYTVGSLLTNGQQGDNLEADALWATVAKQRVPVQVAQPGMQIHTGDGVTLTVLQAQPADAGLDPGDPGQPVSVMLTYGEACVLLSGDLTPEDEVSLLESNFWLWAPIYLLPEDEASGGRSETFVEAVYPQVMVVPPESVAPPPANPNAQIFHLDQTSTVDIVTDGAQLWIQTDR